MTANTYQARAIERALDLGTLLPEGARELRRRAQDAAAYIAEHTG